MMVITLDFGKTVFQHCILVVQDIYSGRWFNDYPNSTQTNYWVQNYDVHIGDDPNYLNNPKCAGSPFMRTDDPNSYTSGGFTAVGESGDMWNFGAEIWCNLAGQYTTIVADYSDLSGAYEMSICQLGVMGTEYVRNTH